MSSGPPKRRRFRFGLRMMFVVVTLAGFLAGWAMHQVHKRNSMRSKIEASGGAFREFQSGGFMLVRESVSAGRVSAWRKLFGDKDEETIVFPHEPSEDEMEAAEFFPEAEVLRYIPDFLSSEPDTDSEPRPLRDFEC